MIFARKVWHLLVAIKDGLVLLFMLLFFLLLFGMLSSRPAADRVREGALLLSLNGSVVEEPSSEDPLGMLIGTAAPNKQYRTRDLARAIRLAASDDRIKAVVLDLSRFTGGGIVSMQEVAAAMDAVRAAKKPVLVYAVAYLDDGLMLAAHASEVWLHPMGAAMVMGPGGTTPYYGDLLKRFGVNVHVYKVGTFKDAVEPYLGNQASAPSREARSALYQSVWETWRADVAKARPGANFDLAAKDPVGWIKASNGDGAQAALKAGLVDKLGDRVAFGERVKALVGADPLDEAPGTFAANKPAALLGAHPVESGGDAVAVVTVAGEIVDGDAGPGTAGGDRIADLIDTANTDGAKALVLRVDSPGGSVLASETIRLALERFKANGRPVVVSMANLAASGGYWVSTPAQRIFAEPGTITGSIGIFAVLPTFEKTLAQYGVNSDGVRTTPLSGQPDILGGLTPETDAVLQATVEQGYTRFLDVVAKSRGKSAAEIDAMAQGRVWDGGTARQKGLVDQFGGLDDAAAWVAKAAKLETWHTEFYGTEPETLAGRVTALLGGGDDAKAATGGDLFATLAARQQLGLDRAASGLARLGQVQGMQAYCLDCAVLDFAPPGDVREGWLARLSMLALQSR
ncbi:signal peptide peptidase SppA [Novosphingobium sp.]|uniref:signal peptide peptidase SppA n=1 Tax=Novosphingobium sp. TaxID=1874826 RepID=UPI00286B3E0E|nr:signal peptide peptidase SppA [Novosphingobium sp.]